MLWDSANSWKAFSASCWWWKCFPCKKLYRCWRSGSWLARGQVNTVDKAKFRSPVHSIFEALVGQCVVRCCCGEELGLFYWPMPASGTVVFSASQWFAEHTSQMLQFHWDSESFSGSVGQQTTKQWPWLFWPSLALRTSLEPPLGPTTELVITGCHIKSTFHHMSQSDWETVHCCCVE